MKEKLLEILEDTRWTILEDVINEVLDDEDPLKSLLSFEEKWIEWWIVECLEFEKDCVKFFNKHYSEIEFIIQHIQWSWHDIKLDKGYSMKHFYSILAFKFISFELYINLVLEDL